MKQAIRVTVLVVACLAAAAGCSLFVGEDGKAWVQLTFNTSQADGLKGSFGGLPSSGYVNTEYEVDPGSYSGDYVLYWSEYVYDAHGAGSYWHYHTYFNAAPGYVYGPSVSSNVSYYQANFYSTYHYDISYTITVNEGTALFKEGEDKHFTIYLDWYPANSLILSTSLAGEEARVTEASADRVVKELTDGRYTIRVEISRGLEGAVGPRATN